jgi:ABC-type Fe3+-hydroxamate transport system substrate-binding protein
MVAGADNFINEMLELNRFENIYKDKGRYPEIELKKIRLEGDPELVFLSSEPYPFKEEDAFEIGRYTHHAKTVFVDGEMFSWYGSRILKAFNYFKKMQEKL